MPFFFPHQKNAQNAQRGRSKPAIMLLRRVSYLLGGAMSWCCFEPARAVPTIWACFPRHGGGSPPAAGDVHLSTPRTSPQSKLGTRGMMNTVDVRGGSPSRLIKLDGTSPLQCTVTKNALVSPLESALTQSLHLKSPGMNTYKKIGVGAGALRANQPTTWLWAPYAQRR